MPQLNPSPWFAILIFSWLVFITVIPPKVAAFTFPNELTAQSTQTPTAEPWNWPWL